MTGENVGEKVFIPHMTLEPTDAQVPFRLCCRQFPVRLLFAMSINKSQGQSVKHVGLALNEAVFMHGQFYVAISQVTSVHNVKIIWDENSPTAATKNIIYPEVLLG